MTIDDGYVLPKPAIPKTLGILNIIFGVLFSLLGICGLGALVAAPALVQFADKTVKDAQVQIESKNKASEKVYDDRIAAAKDDEEKKGIEKEKADFIASRPQLAQPDMSAATDVLNNPKIMAFSLGGGLSGLVLQIMLLISGIGLIRLTPWGRSLAVWWAGIQIVQVLILLAINLAMILPMSQAGNEKQIARMEEIVKTKGANSPEAAALPMTKFMGSFQTGIAVGTSLLGIIYPVIVLALLKTPGARAACFRPKPEVSGEF